MLLMIIEKVYNNRNNANSLIISESLLSCDEVIAVDFTSTTRMVLKFEGTAIEADTDIDPTIIDYSQGNGVVNFNIGLLGVPAGSYYASLIEYDPARQNGQVLFHAQAKTVQFIFVDPL